MIASFIPASFLKGLFVQSEAKLEKFGEVSRNLHLAGIGGHPDGRKVSHRDMCPFK